MPVNSQFYFAANQSFKDQNNRPSKIDAAAFLLPIAITSRLRPLRPTILHHANVVQITLFNSLYSLRLLLWFFTYSSGLIDLCDLGKRFRWGILIHDRGIMAKSPRLRKHL